MSQQDRALQRARTSEMSQETGPAIPKAVTNAIYADLKAKKERELKRKLTEAEAEALQAEAVTEAKNQQAAKEKVAKKAVKKTAKKKAPSVASAAPAKKPAGGTATTFVDTEAQKAAKAEATFRKMSKKEFAELTAGDDGKAETKIAFDPGKAARDAKSTLDKKKAGNERAEKVKKTFSAKLRRLARCKDDNEEKVKAKFTIAPNGRVTSVSISGAASQAKAKCVRDIVKATIFPPGAKSDTYSMPMTL